METNNQAIETYQQQIAPLANALQRAGEILGSIEQPLGELYNQADAAGDEAMRANIMTVWNQSQQLAEQIVPFVETLKAGVAVIEEVREQRDLIAREFGSLLKAIDDFDTSDPRLAYFTEVIESEVSETMYDDALEYAEEAYCSAIDDQFIEFLMLNFNTTPRIAGQLIEMLRDQQIGPPTDEQRALIQQLLDTFKEAVDVSR